MRVNLNKIQQFNDQDVQILEKEPLFKGFFALYKYRFKHRLHNGQWSQEIEREVFERGNAVAVLPYDPVLKEFVLIEQFRTGALGRTKQPWLLEVVAGMIEEGERHEDVCRREAQEEAGLALSELIPIMEYLPSPGGCSEMLSLYFSFVDAKNAGGVFGLEEENEDILVHRVPEQKVMQWLQEGRIINSATIIALQWFALNKERLLADFKNE